MERSRCFPHRFRVGAAFILVFLLISDVYAGAAFFEKKYLVKDVRGEDVMCDPYVIQKGDQVLRLFAQRGEIAHDDFPRFLEIFEILNPAVDDIDTIYPGQKVLIPLRILAPESFEGQASGVVTLPGITITLLPEMIDNYSTSYKVRYGDWVSRLIAQRFGEPGSDSHDEGMELFKKLNPEIKNIDFIMAGQTIRLPDPEIKESPVYDQFLAEEEMVDLTEFSTSAADMADAAAAQALETEIADIAETDDGSAADAGDGPESEPESEAETDAQRHIPLPVETLQLSEPEVHSGGEREKTDSAASSVAMVRGFSDQSVFVKAAAILDGDLINQGEYFFPRQDASDFRLTLSETPLMTFPDGTTILFTKRQWLSADDQQVVELYWPDIAFVFFESQTPLNLLVSKIVSIIAAGDGYVRHLDVNHDGFRAAVRGQYIYDAPGRPETVCLSIIETPDMQVPPSIQNYLETRGIVVRDWVESESMSGWAQDAKDAGWTEGPDAGNVSAPTVKRISPDSPAVVVKSMARELGLHYQSDIDVSFSYAGFEVEASADLLSLQNGKDVLVDYGGLGGDAIAALEKTGMDVLQIKGSGRPGKMISWLADRLPLDFNADPIFWTSARPRLYNPSIQLPGYLVSTRQENSILRDESEPAADPGEGPPASKNASRRGNSEVYDDAREGRQADFRQDGQASLMITTTPLPEAIAAFLSERGVRILEVYRNR